MSKLFLQTNNNSIDITNYCISLLCEDNYIIFPKGRIKRKYLFKLDNKTDFVIKLVSNNKTVIFNHNDDIKINKNELDSYINVTDSKFNENLAFLIPLRYKIEWNNIDDSFLKTLFIKSFVKTFPKNLTYTFYIGIDHDEKIYTKENLIKFFDKELIDFNYKLNITVYYNIEKGFLTRLWNILFKKAYNSKLHNYYYQCGDDIYFYCNWIDEALEKLKKNNNIGLTGPWCVKGNPTILTQTLVSNTHMEIFGYYFNENLKNWGCDNLITKIYQPKYVYPLDIIRFPIDNLGGKPRYNIISEYDLQNNLKIDKQKLTEYLLKNNIL
ncbi:hypothetical protein crov259 [Cafeteria roenbergensis virus]|uniref:Uncharacterized protein n=1 Tax=Cafeteria roenbergensis virus (strain BV-PW1) TaxID=693272 RepID=E3T529_CROVB|nr:hypothetical protein crov259 [Cafeteria roenbergensis virus BV-PW1]ADO67292.1 hypothetical protein crov259 [Cafeteria roenbergensis virus BV-PW1]